MHLRNKHQGRYDLVTLTISNPALKAFVKPNAYNELSIDFANPEAVKELNKALLANHYQIVNWDIPVQYLCPPIPGRADYIHYLADLLGPLKSKKSKGLDIGVGANAIYPLIGQREYGWDFIGTDINKSAIKNAQAIVNANFLNESIQFRLQNNENHIFKGIIQTDDFFDFSMCTPPFHASIEDAQSGTRRKINNLARNSKTLTIKSTKPKLNFGGQGTEPFCSGGELGFIDRMILESALYKSQCHWFTTLVSKASNLNKIERAIKAIGAKKIKIVEMSQGQKKSRFLAWSYMY